MTKEEILKNAIVGVVCDELDYEHGNFQFYKEEVLQAMEDYAESENERLKAERDKILDEVKDEMVDKFDADPMVRRISNMVINEIKSRHKTP